MLWIAISSLAKLANMPILLQMGNRSTKLVLTSIWQKEPTAWPERKVKTGFF